MDLTYFLLAPGSCHLDDIVAALMQYSLIVPIAFDALDGVMDWGGKATLHGGRCSLLCTGWWISTTDEDV